MTTYLDLANEGRNQFGYTSLSLSAVQLNRGDSVETVQAANRALADIIEYSVDFDFNEVTNDVNLTALVQTVSQPGAQTPWDPNVINWIKYNKGDGTLPTLLQVGLERAKELEAADMPNGEPIFYYINQGVLKVIPIPDAVYSLKVGYQASYARITSTNIADTVIFPEHFYNCFVALFNAYWRRNLGDHDADKLEAKASDKLSRAAARNKFGAKKEGMKKFRPRPRIADRKF